MLWTGLVFAQDRNLWLAFVNTEIKFPVPQRRVSSWLGHSQCLLVNKKDMLIRRLELNFDKCPQWSVKKLHMKNFRIL